MTASRRGTLALPFVAAAVLAAAGGYLLAAPSDPAPEVRAPASVVVGPAAPGAEPGPPKVALMDPAVPHPADPAAGAGSSPTPSAGPGRPQSWDAADAGRCTADLAATTTGQVSDACLQVWLARTAPSDLAPELERQLVPLAGRVLIADTTGAGRGDFGDYFASGLVRGYSQVRILAGTAHRSTTVPDAVEVTLLWSGTDPWGQAETRNQASVLLGLRDGRWLPIQPP